MSVQNRNSRLFNQQVIDSGIEQLVRESAVPQMLFPGQHSSNGNSSFVQPCSSLGRQMSASAIPKIHGYATASPCARFEPFRSPQSLNSTFPSNTSYPSAADIFKSLKNQSKFDEENSLDTSQESHYKENNSAVANSVSGRHIGTHSHKQPQTHASRNLNPNGNFSKAGDKKLSNWSYSQQTSNLERSIINVESHQSKDSTSNVPGYDTGRSQYNRRGQHVYTGHGKESKVDNCYEETFQEAFNSTGTDEEDEFLSPERVEACSLYMWIIKPVPGTHSICVEGKKSLEDENFWHSGVISYRINEKVVETQTRSVYRLEGNMELLDAMAAGFSRKIAEAFWLGFPSDWQQLIQEHFSSAPLNSIEEKQSDSEEEITTLEDFGEDSYDQDTGQEETALTEVTSADEGEESVPTSQIVEVEKVALHSPVDNKKGLKKGRKPEVVLENWIIKSLPNGKGVHVLGTKQDSGLLWHSSAIEKRLDKKRLMSSSGSVYRLKGNIDKLLALNEGLPAEIIDKFSSGFPKEWLEMIQEFLSTKKPKKKVKSKDKKLSTSKKKGQVEDKKGRDQKESAQSKKVTKKSETPTQNKTMKVKDGMRDQQKSVNNLKKSSRGNKQEGNATPANMYKQTKTVITPNGEMVDLECLGRSRSGRLIKPPLQWWTGQHLKLDGDTISVKAPTIASSMFLQEFEDGFKKSKHKVKPYWNPRQKDKDYSLNMTKSLNSSASSFASEKKHKTQKEEKKAISKTVDNTSQSEDDLEQSMKLILENVKGKMKKIKKRETCYSSEKQLKKNSTATENPFDLNETTDLETETEQESSDAATSKGLRSKGRGDKNTGKKIKTATQKEIKRNVDQVNVVSSSTGDVHHELNAGEGKTCRVLRSRKGKVPEPLGTKVEVVNKVRRTQRGKVLPVIVEDEIDDHVESNDEDFKPVKKSKKGHNVITSKRKHSMERGGDTVEIDSKHAVAADDRDDHWTKDEKNRLKEACKKVPTSNPHYWEKVAAEVRTKTAEMCKAMFYSDQKQPKSAEKKNKKNVKEKAKVTSLTANVGTLKRKQQLKDLLEQQNENYCDDLFDSTPYRMTRKRKVHVRGGDDDDDTIFEELARKQGKTRFETPVATETMYSRITVPFASTKKTPVSNVSVEMLEGSGDADGYAHKILKRRLLAKGKKKFETAKPVKKVPDVDVSPQQKLLFHNYLKEKKDSAENYHDSDQEEDFYWEDEAEN